jgi:hypothetical protein
MVEPTSHCPYLGLKQNQAIRFASPTPEHRCYAAGLAQEIPLTPADYQHHYCLSPNHVRCPLYTGSGLASTLIPAPVPQPRRTGSTGGVSNWLAGLPLRDRMIYLGLLILLGLILIAYALAGLGLLQNGTLFGSPDRPTVPGSGEPTLIGITQIATPVPATGATATATSTATAAAPATATPTVEILPTIEAVTASPTPRPIFIPLPPTNTPVILATPLVPTEAPPAPTEAPPVPTEAPPVPTEAPPVPTEVPPVPTEAPPVPTEAPPVPTSETGG